MKPSAGSLSTRIAALEAARQVGPLSQSEAAELRHLQAEHDARFAGPITTWSTEQLEDFIRNECTTDGPARRLDELRQRNRGPEQDAADRRRLAVFLGIAEDQLAAFTADAIRQLTVNRSDYGRTDPRGD